MTDKTPGWGALLSGKDGIRSLALAGGVALHAINVYLVTTILPSVVRDIGGLDYYAWNTTLFVIASIVGASLASRLLRRAGPRRAYVMAAALFGFGTLICALAPSMPVMLGGRLVQGAGGGVLLALTYAMIRIVFPPALWPRAMGLVSGMWGVATLIGPALGGIFADLDAWRWAFGSVIPAVILFAVLAFMVLPAENPAETPDDRPSRLPSFQLALLCVIVLTVSVASASSSLAVNLSGMVISLLLMAALVMAERRAEVRLFPRGSLSLKTQLGLVFATMSFLSITVTSSEIFVPLFLQVLHGQSPLVAGYLAAIMGGAWSVGSIACSGARGAAVPRIILAAPLLAIAGMVGLAILVPPGSTGGFVAIASISVALSLVGLGVGSGWPHLLTQVLQVAPADEQVLASASITTVQLFAKAVGAALAGMVANMGGLTDPGGFTGTSAASLWLFVVFAIAPVLGLFTALRVARALR